MAMAFLSEPGEDDSSPYPPAPPPSPESIPRNLQNRFELPLSKFQGLERERHRFDSPNLKLSPPSPGPYNFPSKGGGGGDAVSPTDTSPPPYGFEGLDGSAVQSAVTSSYQFPVSVSSPIHHSQSLSPEATLSDFHSPPKRAHSARIHSHSSPQHILGSSGQQLANGFSDLTLHSSPSHNAATEPSSQLLSRSFDSHLLHPHLEESFDTVTTEVRPSRAYSLGEDASQRRRKISLKRRNDEIDGDPNLQFTFDISYSSTSSTESEWVVVDSSSSNYPQGKKACWQDHAPPGTICSSHLPPAVTLSNVVTTLASSTVPHVSLQKPPSLDYQPPAVMTSIREMAGQTSVVQQPAVVTTRRNGTHFHAFSSPANFGGVGLQMNHGIQHSRLNGQGYIPPQGAVDQQSRPSAVQEALHSGKAGHDSIHTTQEGLQSMAGRVSVQEGFVAPSLQAHDSLLMMDCGDYGAARLDSLDSMDVCQSEGPDGAVEMESLGPISLEQHSSMQDGGSATGGAANIGRSHSSMGNYSNSVLIPPHSVNSSEQYFASDHHSGANLDPPGGSNEEDVLQSRLNFSKSL